MDERYCSTLSSSCAMIMVLCLCVCVFFPFILDIKFVDVPVGVTQEEGHTGFLHLPSAVRPLISLARRIQPFLSLVGREVEFCRSPLVGHFFFFFFSEKNPVHRDRTHVPTCQKVTRLPLSYRGDRLMYLTYCGSDPM